MSTNVSQRPAPTPRRGRSVGNSILIVIVLTAIVLCILLIVADIVTLHMIVSPEHGPQIITPQPSQRPGH